jgi:opacity protein-like surface antigen
MKKKLMNLLMMLVAFSTLTGICQAQKRFSFKVTGGYGTMSIGDINVLQENLENTYNEWASLPDASKEGEFKKLNTGFEYEGELTISLNEHFGIGIGAGYIQRKEASEVAFELDSGDLYLYYDFSYRPKLSAIPIKLSVYYYLPIIPRMNLFLNGGIGYYFGKLNYRRHWESQQLYEGYEYYELGYKYDIDAKDNGIGFHGGFGLEYNVKKNLAFFVEGVGRSIKLSAWEGDEIRFTGITFENGKKEETTTTNSGILWYYEVYSEIDPGNISYVLKTQEEKPRSSRFVNIRKAEGNFSGISLRIGFRVKF